MASTPTVTHADGMRFMVEWWMAVREQYQRIMPTRPTYAIAGTRRVNVYMFVLAAHNLRTAAELVKRTAPPELHERFERAIDDFDNEVPDIRKVRNALAHFDAFAYGAGVAQKAFPNPHFGIYLVDHDNECELVLSLAPQAPVLRIMVERTFAAGNELFRAIGLAVDHLPMPKMQDFLPQVDAQGE